jgi:prophage regulatory protein
MGLNMADRLPENLTFAELRRFVPYSRFHISRLEADGKFPKRIKLGEGPFGRVVWCTSEILAWLEAKRKAA